MMITLEISLIIYLTMIEQLSGISGWLMTLDWILLGSLLSAAVLFHFIDQMWH